jgi:hypothetical protein
VGSNGFTVSLSDPFDPGSKDTFEYRFDCGSGTYEDWASSSSAHCSADNGPATLDVRAQIRDDDDGVSKQYTGSVEVKEICSFPIPDTTPI